MTMVAHTHPYVIGVDTHARSHAFAILAMPHGEVVEERQFPTTVAGIARAVQWVSRRTGGDLGVLWVVECAATYGAQLARACRRRGLPGCRSRPDERQRQPWRGQVGPAGCATDRRVGAGAGG